MPLPTFSKNWKFNVNQSIPKQLTYRETYRKIWFYIKESLKVENNGNWTVVRSCDGVNVSSSDLWLNDTLITNFYTASSSPRSWIILRNSSISSLFEICIDSYEGLSFAPYGFNLSTGSTSAIPSTNVTNDKILTNYSGQFTGTGNSLYDYVLHVLQSYDGESLRIIVCQGGVTSGIIFLDKSSFSVTGMTWPIPFFYGVCYSNSLTSGLSRSTGSTTYSNFYIRIGSSPSFSTYTCTPIMTEGDYGSAVPNTLGRSPFNYGFGLGGDYMLITPAHLQSLVNSASAYYTYNGYFGKISDTWIGSQYLLPGTAYVNDSNEKILAQFGPFVLPWDTTKKIKMR